MAGNAPKEEAERLKEEYILGSTNRKGDLYQLRVICPEKPIPDAVLADPNLEDAYLLYLSKDERAAGWGEQLAGR